MKAVYLTQEKKDAFQKELDHLKLVVRPEISTRLKDAYELGDLPENAEYDAARSEQGRNETRIQYLEFVLKHAVAIERTRDTIDSMSSEFLTQQKKDELEAELAHLKSVVRPDISARLQAARAMGDLSENAEYQTSRDEQGKNETRIQQIEHILKNAKVIERTGNDTVELGATVIIKKTETSEEKTFMIVDDAEADISQNKISTSSPIGSAMFGKKVGDTFVTVTPRGEMSYQIIKIS